MVAMKPVATGRLIALKFKRNLAAREDALASVRKLPSGRWQARIGGRIRGRTDTFMARSIAEAAVNDHYNGVMVKWLKEGTWKS